VPIPRSQKAPTPLDAETPRAPTLRRILAGGAVLAFLACIVVAALALPRHKEPTPPQFRETDEIGVLDTATSERLLSSPAPAPAANEARLAQRAREILTKHCYRCHGDNGAAEGGFNYLLDRDKLLARKKIKARDAVHSKLYRRLHEGEMPPEGEQPRPTDADVQLIRQWIEAGAPADRPAPPPRNFVRDNDILAMMLADVLTLPARERRFLRYFTLVHLSNAGLSEDELQTYRHALAKLVNSLSWRGQIVVPRPIDAARTVFRIDVRDYGWNAKVWQRIAAAYPYGVRSDSPTAQAVAAAVGCEQPSVRADWFVATAARPPLYHDLLQLPDSDGELEKQLKVEVADNIDQERVARAGFNGSGVSRNNRLIERHELAFGGAYWKSYDFADNVGRHNLFARPLGPGRRVGAFEQSGGEIIFNLPNGLQGYMLVDGRGQRIDKGPTAIVSDPRRPDRAVENGLSCMTCHTRGILPKSDQIRKHVEKNPNAFPVEEIALIKSLYPPEDRFRVLQEQDAERFRTAVAKTGGRVGATEPIVTLAVQFESELDLIRTAAEVGCTADEFRKHLEQSATLARSLGSLKIANGTIQRQVFTESFADIVRALGLGSPRTRTD
jgi:mono/diheme cytochrome c family protein